MKQLAIITLLAIALLATGCWDEIKHAYDQLSSGEDVEDDTETDEDAGPDDAGSGDTESDTWGTGQGDLPPGWGNFGGPCETDDDCTGYSDRARCIQDNILGVINVPGGYCSACCDEAGSYCADNIQCIGIDDLYLICAVQCDEHEDCRQDEGYECRTIPPYLDTSPFPGTFCLPDKEHMEPEPGTPPTEVDCDWPWLE